MKIKLAFGTLYKKERYKVSRGFHKPHDCIMVQLEHGGFSGYGSATAFSVYKATIDQMKKSLGLLASKFKGYKFSTPEVFWKDCSTYIKDDPFALSAIDTAAYDLYGKMHNKTVYELLGIGVGDAPYSSISISMGDIDFQKKKIREYKKWPFVKLKMADATEIEKILELGKDTDARFFLDANCGTGWGCSEILDSLNRLQNSKVDMLEQPLKKDDYDLMQEIKEKNTTGIKLFADESFTKLEDVALCADSFDGINLKIMKVGGITPTLEIVREAREKGLEIMAGCMPENTISIAATANLAPLFDYVDIDSLELHSNDFAKGIYLDSGKIMYTGMPGLGFRILDDVNFN